MPERAARRGSLRRSAGLFTALCAGVAAGGTRGLASAEGAGPQWLVGWASGDVVSQVRPGTTLGCDASLSCEETVNGSGEARFLTAPRPAPANFDFVAIVTADLPGTVPNGAGGTCYPASGVLSLTGAATGQGTLVFDVQGSDCTLGSSTTRRVITGTFAVDGAASTGTAAGATGVGSFNWLTDASVPPAVVTFSFSGCVTGFPAGILNPIAAVIAFDAPC
jgi:hypothetical protein